MKVLVKKGVRIFQTTQSLGDFRKAETDTRFLRKLSRIVKNTCIAIFSFSLQKTFMSLPLIPRYVKVEAAKFMKEHIYKYYLSSFKMIHKNVDK